MQFCRGAAAPEDEDRLVTICSSLRQDFWRSFAVLGLGLSFGVDNGPSGKSLCRVALSMLRA